MIEEQQEKLTFPHQEVMEHYEIEVNELPKNSKALVESLENRISKLDSMEDGDDKVNELKDIANKSKMFAATIVEGNKKDDSAKERKEIEEDIKKSTDSIKQEIKRISEDSKADEQRQRQRQREREQRLAKTEEEEVPPPTKESKIEAIISFFENNNSATLEDLKNLGLNNINGDIEEIELVPDKYRIVKKSGDKYVLKKKDDGILGWIFLGAGVLVAGIFGYKYLKKK